MDVHAQGAHQEMKKLFRSLKEKGSMISRLESQLSTGRFCECIMPAKLP